MVLDASYLADAVILLRYFEDRGEVRQAVICHEEAQEHERTARVQADGGRISVGHPARFRGVLTGVPF
jgi:circadian clock protein KaiC